MSVIQRKLSKPSRLQTNISKQQQTEVNKQLLRATHQPKVEYSFDFSSNPHLRSEKKIYTESSKEIQDLKKQNQSLRNQVKWLKGCLQKEKIQNHPDTDLFEKITKLESQKANLKRIIEKSYYSIKQMEKQHDRLLLQVNETKQAYKQNLERMTFLEIQNDTCKKKIQQITQFHKQQVHILNERVHSMQHKIEKLVELFERQRKQWKKQQNDLMNLKRSYSKTKF